MHLRRLHYFASHTVSRLVSVQGECSSKKLKESDGSKGRGPTSGMRPGKVPCTERRKVTIC